MSLKQDIDVTHLMRFKFGVIQLSECIFHVIVANELHDSRSILIHVCVTDITRFTHMVFQILPAATRWQS